MTGLRSPAALAAVATLLALVVHPGLHLERLPQAPGVAAGLGLLLGLALLLRAGADRGATLLALGALLTLLGLGYDALRGHIGTLTLAPGQAVRNFEELGPGGRRLGLRPLGFDLGLVDVDGAGNAQLEIAGKAATATQDRALGAAGLRLGTPRATATGQPPSLRIGVRSSQGSQELDLVPGEAATLGELRIEIQQYFPDFALDGKQQPFSRSEESRNPAALLNVRRGDRAFRVFVIEAMPEIHRQQGLDQSFSLLSVDAKLAVTLSVTREPAAVPVAFGLIAAAFGVVLGSQRP